MKTKHSSENHIEINQQNGPRKPISHLVSVWFNWSYESSLGPWGLQDFFLHPKWGPKERIFFLCSPLWKQNFFPGVLKTPDYFHKINWTIQKPNVILVFLDHFVGLFRYDIRTVSPKYYVTYRRYHHFYCSKLESHFIGFLRH